MNKPRSIARSKSDDTGRNIQSRIARYIRGEISANMITTNSSSKMDCSDQSTSTIVMGGGGGGVAGPTISQTSRRGLFVNKLRSRIRPPFRNTVNVKNTNFSSLAMAYSQMDLKGTTTSATAIDSGADECPVCEIDTICLCQSEAVRRFVPEPGFYMASLTQKLAALQSRNSSN